MESEEPDEEQRERGRAPEELEEGRDGGWPPGGDRAGEGLGEAAG